MKRLISLFIVFALSLSLIVILTSCGEDAPEKEPLTEEEWKEMLHSKNFENYTIAISHTVIPEEKHKDPTEIQLVFKVVGEKNAVFKSEENADEIDDVNEDVAEITKQKGIYIQIYQRILSGFDDFTYNEEKDVYELKKRFEIIEAGSDTQFFTGSYVDQTIFHPVFGDRYSTSVPEYKDATKTRMVSGTKITVKINEEGRISEVFATYIDSTTYIDKKTDKTLDSSYVTVDVAWTFSDYGTTAID